MTSKELKKDISTITNLYLKYYEFIYNIVNKGNIEFDEDNCPIIDHRSSKVISLEMNISNNDVNVQTINYDNDIFLLNGLSLEDLIEISSYLKMEGETIK